MPAGKIKGIKVKNQLYETEFEHWETNYLENNIPQGRCQASSYLLIDWTGQLFQLHLHSSKQKF